MLDKFQISTDTTSGRTYLVCYMKKRNGLLCDWEEVVDGWKLATTVDLAEDHTRRYHREGR